MNLKERLRSFLLLSEEIQFPFLGRNHFGSDADGDLFRGFRPDI